MLVLPLAIAPIPVVGAGQSVWGIIPCDPVLLGLSIFLQVLDHDSGARRGVSFTPGLELVVGDC